MPKTKPQRSGEDFMVVVGAVSAFLDMTPESIVSPASRNKAVVLARQYVIFLSQRFIPTITSVELGELLKTDHTGILYGSKTLIKKLSKDKKIATDLRQLTFDLQEQFKLKNEHFLPDFQVQKIKSTAEKVWTDLHLGKVSTKEDFISYFLFILKR